MINPIEIQNKFNKGEISFNEYSASIINWNQEYHDILKSKFNSRDPSKGGKLVQKKGFDKQGNKTTKWVKREDLNDSGNNGDGDLSDSNKPDSEFKYNISEWENGASKASEIALNNALKYAKSETVRSIARNELFLRSFNPKKFIDMSLLPDDMLNDYISRYTQELTKDESKSVNNYRDWGYKSINDKLRNVGSEFDGEEIDAIDTLTKLINKSELKNDLILYRGINGKTTTLFINFLKSRKVGDIYEEKAFSSTSLIKGQAIKFKDLFASNNNLILKIYASKGQRALSMHNIGNESEKQMYNEFEFLLPQNSKFQIIESKGNEISVKLL